MNDAWTGAIGLIVLLILFCTGLELAFSMALVGFLGYCITVSAEAGFSMLVQDLYSTFSSYGFTVIPVFILMGQIALNGKIAKELYDSAHKMVGQVPGGLAIATVGGAAMFGAITGATTAVSATFSSIAIPEMDRFGYKRLLSTGVVASAGTLGCLIPPSVPLIVYGIITEQSIGKLFLASVIPGVIVALLFCVVIIGWCTVDPKMGPKGEKYSLKARLASLKDVSWVVLIFIVVIGGLLSGFFTPTEAGSVGAFSVGLLALCKKKMGAASLIKSLKESLVTATMVLFLIAGSTIFGHFITVTKLPMLVAEWTVSLPLHRHLIVALIGFIYLLGGSFIDDLAFMILATPIFFPAISKLGYDLIWFGIFIQLVVMVGVVLPPVAVNVFVVRNITGESLKTIYKGVTPFLLSFLSVIILIFLCPQLTLFLPSLMGK